MKFVIVGILAWIVRELVVKRDQDEQQRARAILSNRLEKAYAPLYYLGGELVQASLSGNPGHGTLRGELRALLATQGHHFREEHLRFCADLLAGRHPSDIEVLWHRHSVKREVDRLKVLVYGPAAELESALDRNAPAILLRLAFRVGDYILAAAFWFGVVIGLAILVVGDGQGNVWLLLTLLLGAMVFRVLQEAVRGWRFRRRFRVEVLRRVKRGSKGDDVRLLQTMLKLSRDLPIGAPVDGVFGRDTESALRRFQEKSGLRITGRLDKASSLRLYAEIRHWS